MAKRNYQETGKTLKDKMLDEGIRGRFFRDCSYQAVGHIYQVLDIVKPSHWPTHLQVFIEGTRAASLFDFNEHYEDKEVVLAEEEAEKFRTQQSQLEASAQRQPSRTRKPILMDDTPSDGNE